mgnify:CR=1 FL=1
MPTPRSSVSRTICGPIVVATSPARRGTMPCGYSRRRIVTPSSRCSRRHWEASHRSPTVGCPILIVHPCATCHTCVCALPTRMTGYPCTAHPPMPHSVCASCVCMYWMYNWSISARGLTIKLWGDEDFVSMSVFNCNYSQTGSPHNAPSRVLPAYTYIAHA